MKLAVDPPPTVQPAGTATQFVADPPPTAQPGGTATKLVAEPPPTLQPLGYATKFVADPPPTLQPVYLFGKVISPVVKLMSTWKVAPPPVPASVPPPADGEPHPLHWKATTASRSA